MSEVKVKHEGGDKKSRPTSGATHKEQMPGKAAGGQKMGEMGWNGPHHGEHKHKYVK